MNAAEATRPHGSGRVSCRHALHGRRHGASQVSDDGEGIPKETARPHLRSRSSPPRTRARAWASAWPWSTASSSPTAASIEVESDRRDAAPRSRSRCPLGLGTGPWAPRSPSMRSGRPERAGRGARGPRHPARSSRPWRAHWPRRSGCRCCRLAALDEPARAFDAAARAVELGRVPRGAAEPACRRARARLLGVTERDLFVPVLSFVYGQAQLGGRVAVVSLARLRPEFHGLPGWPGRRSRGARARRPSTRSGTRSGSCTASTAAARCRFRSTSPDLDGKTATPCAPARGSSRGAVTMRRTRARTEGEQPMRARWHILVVDDEEAMTESLAAWLREDGYTVDTASSGARRSRRRARASTRSTSSTSRCRAASTASRP